MLCNGNKKIANMIAIRDFFTDDENINFFE